MSYLFINMINVVVISFYHYHDYIDNNGSYDHTSLTIYNTIVKIFITLVIVIIMIIIINANRNKVYITTVLNISHQ